MPEEIQEAVQIIRVAFDGVEVAMKVGSGGLGFVKKTASLFKGLLDYEKLYGKTSMRKLLLKGGDLQVLQVDEERLKDVRKMAKKYGVLYSVLPDANKDGVREIVFHNEAVPRVNLMIKRLGYGRLLSFDDFLKNGNEKELNSLLDFLQKQTRDKDQMTPEGDRVRNTLSGLIEKVGLYAAEKGSINAGSVSENFKVDDKVAEDVMQSLVKIGMLGDKDKDGNYKAIMDKESFENRLKGYQELSERIMKVSSANNKELVDISVNKSLVAEETETAIKTRVPGRYGNNAAYIWIDKGSLSIEHNGKTILTYLDKNKQYTLVDKFDRVVSKMNGAELSKSYSGIEKGLNKVAEKNHGRKTENIRTNSYGQQKKPLSVKRSR